MKILIACDSFKGSLSSKRIIEIFKECAEKADFDAEIIGVQIADGGEGTLDAILSQGEYKTTEIECKNPLFEKIQAKYIYSDDTAVIEMATASGLTLIKYADGNAMKTTTYGTGELISDAVKRGAKHIYICIGGSATNDGGIGALAALGFKFLDRDGNILSPTGENLIKIAAVDKNHALNLDGIKLTVVADVKNPLIGKNGATYVYGKQKGAIGEFADMLEKGMKNYADITEKATGIRLHDRKSAGAAGGLGGGLIAYLGAEVESGIDCVLKIIGFDETLKNADAVITGEGNLDSQSLNGKAVFGVCKAAERIGVPVYIMAGGSEIDSESCAAIGIKGIATLIEDAESLDDAIKNAEYHGVNTAEKLLRIIAEDLKV